MRFVSMFIVALSLATSIACLKKDSVDSSTETVVQQLDVATSPTVQTDTASQPQASSTTVDQNNSSTATSTDTDSTTTVNGDSVSGNN